MAVCRFIFRLDFKLNYELVNAPGTVMRFLGDVPEKFWGNYGESSQQRQIIASYVSPAKDLWRQMDVTPQAMFGAVETVAGIGLKRMESDESFTTMFRLASAVIEKFGIDVVKRMGFRVFYFSKIGKADGLVLQSFRQSLRPQLVNAIEESIGTPSDYGIAVDGEAADRIAYHFRCGPFEAKESGKYFEHIDKELFRASADYDFVCDLDLFESDFSLAKVPLSKWYRALVARQTKLIENCESAIRASQRG